MGDEQTQPGTGTELERLQREVERKYWDLRATLEELDKARTQHRLQQARPRTREEVKRSLRVINGGAAVVGAAAAWAWEAARKPALAVVAGTGALTTGSLITAPMVEPGTAAPLPVIVRTAPRQDAIPAEQTEQRARRTPEPVAETPAPSAVDKAPVVPAVEPYTPMATQQPEPKPSPTPKPTLVPTPTPTASVTVTAPPIVDIDVNADSDKACVDSELVGLELAVCLEAATR